jgi:hypothetical protein
VGQRRRMMVPAVLAALSIGLVAAGCGGSDSGDSGGGESAASADGKSYISFAFSPDPLWDYMKRSGLVPKMGEEDGVNVTQLTSFDEFGLFAGGHADIVSTGSYETPLFDQNGVETVTFGKYNMNKEQMFVANPDYKSTKDFPPGCKVGVLSTTGVFYIWQPLIEALDGRKMTENPESDTDLPVLTAEEAVLPTLLEKGEICGAIYNPYSEAFVNDTRTGKIHPMYDGKGGSELFAEKFAPGHDGVNSNMFVARKDWFDSHHKEVAAFLKLWQQGVDAFYADRDKIIMESPDDWGITQPGDEEFVFGLLDKWNFTNKSVYLDEEWINNEKKVFDLAKDGGVFKEDQYFPEHAVIDPETGEVTATIGGKDGE